MLSPSRRDSSSLLVTLPARRVWYLVVSSRFKFDPRALETRPDREATERRAEPRRRDRAHRTWDETT
eukprot:4711717-Prymnesium_polylepis.1